MELEKRIVVWEERVDKSKDAEIYLADKMILDDIKETLAANKAFIKAMEVLLG